MRPRLPIPVLAACLLPAALAHANANVHVSRFWHNHQPIYWPEWNTNGGETNRVEYAWDSISLKFARSYPGSTANHPENNLGDIFGKDDRRAAYQGGPRNALTNIDTRGGFAMSYSGSLIDNIRQLGGGGLLGYGGDEVGAWTDLPMTKRTLPKTQAALNAAVDNGEINYFIEPPELADYYFTKINGTVLHGFRNKLLDYYIEATDSLGNVHRSEIQRVFVEDDGGSGESPGPDPAPGPDPEPETGFTLGAADDTLTVDDSSAPTEGPLFYQIEALAP